MSIEKIGPYRLGQRLGRQNRHQVFSAVHEETGNEVAIKLVKITSKVDRDFAVKRIELELRILKRLDHPNLVRIYDADIEGDLLYFVMEKVDAEPLSAILGRRNKLAWDLVLDYSLQIARALEYLHEQDLLHLKLTPDKVLVSPEGKVWLSDMRVNRARKRRWDDSGNRVLDTAAYLAPEQLAGEDVSTKCDMYSLGVMMFEAITGKIPFAPETMGRLIQRKKHLSPPSVAAVELDVPVWIDRLIAQLVHGDAARRPHTMHAVVLSIEEAQKMDASKMGVAQRAARGFNPVTIGKDSEEARRLLGMRKKPEGKPRDYSVVLLSVALMVVVLLLGIGMGWALTPAKPEKLMAKARELVAAGDMQSLLLAQRDCLNPVLERDPEGPFADEARELLDLSEARIAGCRIEFDLDRQRPARSRGEQRCMEAWLLEDDEEWLSAWETYGEAAAESDLDSEDRGFHLFAKLRQKELARLIANAEGAQAEFEARLDEVLALVETDRPAAIEKLTVALALYDQSESMTELVTTSRNYLENLKALEAEAASQAAANADSGDAADSTTDEGTTESSDQSSEDGMGDPSADDDTPEADQDGN